MIKLNDTINYYSEKDPFTNFIGLGRSLIALSTLFSLLFNSREVLFFHKMKINTLSSDNIFSKFSVFEIFGYQNVLYAQIISIIILLIVIIGIFPKITCLLHLWVQYSYVCSVTLVEGGDHLGQILCILLIPICLLDPRNNHWQKNPRSNEILNIIANITLAVIKIQICFVYLHSFVGKLKVAEWLDGTVLYYWFKHPIYGYPDYLNFIFYPFINNNILTPLLTWCVLLIEALLFMGLLAKNKYKYYLLRIGILFHFMIIIIHGLPNFFLVMASALVFYLGNEKNFNLPNFITYKIYIPLEEYIYLKLKKVSR